MKILSMLPVVASILLIAFYAFIACAVFNRRKYEEMNHESAVTINDLAPGTTFIVEKPLKNESQYEIVILEPTKDHELIYSHHRHRRFLSQQGLVPKKVVYQVERVTGGVNMLGKINVPGLSYL